MAVAADKIDLDVKATELYRRSAEKGNTLAMANLAQRYLSKGFIEEADHLIKKALKDEEPHENVPYALSKINEKLKNDKEEWTGTLTKASAFRDYMRRYASAYFNENNKLGKFPGEWFTEDGLSVELTGQNQKVTAEWIGEPRGLMQTVYKYELTGNVHNNAAILKYTRRTAEKGRSLGLLGAQDIVSYDCYAYIAENQDEIHIMAYDPKKDFRMKLMKKNT